MTTIVFLATAWGSKHGGINVVNSELAGALAAVLAAEGRVLCVVPSADDKEVEDARVAGVTLVPLGPASEDSPGIFDPKWIGTAEKALETHDVQLVDWCIGHDSISGAAANLLRKNGSARGSVVISHMSYADYQGVKHDSFADAERKHQDQVAILKEADVVLAVGPLLRDRASDIIDAPVKMFVPGLSTVAARPARRQFTAVSFGRFEMENDRIKQIRLVAEGLAEACRRASEPGGPAILNDNPTLKLIGVSKNDAEAADLRKIMSDRAGRVINLRPLPYQEDRQQLFSEISGSTLALMLSWHEGFGLTGWEAIAAELPLIVSKQSGLYHFLREEGMDRQVHSLNVDGSLGNNDAPNFTDRDLTRVANVILDVAGDLSNAQKVAKNLKSQIVFADWTWHRAATTLIEALGIARLPGLHVANTGGELGVGDDSAKVDAALSEIPFGLRPPVFVGRGRSARLDAAVDQVLASLDSGNRIVAIRGTSGDGKTQVARQVAATRGGYYVELGNQDDAESALGEGLSFVVEAFGEPSCGSRPLPIICAIVRATLHRGRKAPLLVIDALDASCPRQTLEALLGAEFDGALVVVGPGASGVPDIVLAPADAEEFEKIFEHRAELGRPLAPRDQELLSKIASGVGYCPLSAELVAESVRHEQDVSAALIEHLATLKVDGAGIDPQITGSVAKVWKHLDQSDQTRVSLVAILGDPGVPVTWLPRKLGSSTSRPPLLSVSERKGERHFEAHRIVASFAQRSRTPGLGRVLLDLLESWVKDESLLDELKAQGARSRALIRGFRHLKAIDENGLSPSARLSKAFVDAAPASTPELLLQHLSFVVGDAAQVAALPLDVVGEVVDQISPSAARANDELQSIRTAAAERLFALARSEESVPVANTEAARELASAMHHAAKALLRTRNSSDEQLAIMRFEQLELRCQALLAQTPGKRRLLVDLAQIRLQTTRSSLLAADVKTGHLRDVLAIAGDALPVYLRLALISAALGVEPYTSLTSADQLALVRQGLTLCGPRTIVDTQANFLRTAVAVCDRVDAAGPVWNDITRVARSLAAPLVADVLGDKGVAALGHALVKGTSRDTSRGGVEAILAALTIYDVPVENAGLAVLSRIAAALRELGLPAQALPIATALYNGAPLTSRYFQSFELAKVLRACGDYGDALAVIESEMECQRRLPDGARNLAPLGDEFVKSAVRMAARRGDVLGVLKDNVRRYNELGRAFYAERCARWGETIDLDPLCEERMAEDEWRASVRGDLLTPAERERASAVAVRAAARADLIVQRRPVNALSP
jgi:glycosyltransferase involved in cell wall biosynthesis